MAARIPGRFCWAVPGASTSASAMDHAHCHPDRVQDRSVVARPGGIDVVVLASREGVGPTLIVWDSVSPVDLGVSPEFFGERSFHVSVWNKAGVVAVSALTALAMTACGSTPGSSSEAAKQPGVLELLASDLKGSLQKTVEATDKSDSVSLTMLGTVAGEKISMKGVLDLGDPVKAELTVDDPEGSTTVRMFGQVVYFEIPAEDRAGTGGKRWMKLDMSAAGEQAGMNFSKQFEDMDPIKQVKTLLATEGVMVVGEETVNGAPAVHYTVTTPMATYLGQLDAELRAGVEKELTRQGVKEVKIDLWVDEQYRPRRVGMVMGTVSDMTVDYTDYGKPVTIETPSPAETTDFAEMMAGLKDLAAGS